MTQTATELTSEEIADLAAGYALDKKAQDVVALDLRGLNGFTDAFVICSGTSDRQAKAIHDAIHFGLKKDHGLLPRRVEGVTESRWILMDYLDVVIHVFAPEAREFYRLETLWGDAKVANKIPGWIEAVTSEDVQRTARTYLTKANRTVIDRKPAPMHISKVALADPKDGKPTRVRFETNKDGRKVRVAVKSGETIDG